MTGAATSTRQEHRRLELRLSPQDWRRLEREAKAAFRSPASHAAHLVVRGLREDRDGATRSAD